MKEIEQIPSICTCGRRLNMRLSDVVDEGKIIAWMIHGFCKKCEKVFFISLISQVEEPVQNRDFMLVDKIVEVDEK